MAGKPPRYPRWTGLEALRRNAGHSKTSLARAAGLTQQALSQIENGDRRGHPASIKAIAHALGMKAMELEATREAPGDASGTDALMAEVA